MWRAALPCRRTGIALFGLMLAATLAVGPSSARNSAQAAPSGELWALALPESTKTVDRKQLTWLATRGITTIVAFKQQPKSLRRLAAAAKGSRLVVIAPRLELPRTACKSAAGSTLRTCAAIVGTPRAAVRLARRGLVDYVVIRVRTPQQLRMLRGTRAKRSRILAILPLVQRSAGRAAWRSGVAYASADPALDLGVSAPPHAKAQLGSYLSALPRTRKAVAAPIQAPTSLLVTGRSTSTITLRWTAASGEATGYGVYTDGEFVLDVSALSITLTGLQCGRAYTFGVDAYGSGGRSNRISATSSTNACPSGAGAGGSGGSSTDAVSPTTPVGLSAGAATQTSIFASWGHSTDNVGVAGYGLFVNGSNVGSSLVSTASFSGLACGTTYTLSVDAYDEAGNRSSRTSVSAATNPCTSGGDTSAPSTPGSMTKTGSTTTSISVSWGAASDNVGVGGYGLYRNGASTGSTPSLGATFSGLACGSSYSLAVDAYDAAGNRSAKRSLTAATAACPPSLDTQAPSVPQGMAFTTVTETTVGLTWLPSTDNVGVAGYRLLRNGVSVATAPAPGYTFGGLTCETAYTFTLEAYDATGNSSNGAEASGSTSTSACPGDEPPPPPPPPPAAGTVHVAPGGNLNTAYSQAGDGWTIQLAAGDYGVWRPGGGSKRVTVKGVSGTRFRQLYSNFDNVVFDGLQIDAGRAKTSGGAAFESHGDNATFKNGSIGNVTDEKGALVSGSNFTFDNVLFHDVRLATPGVHNECIYAIIVPGFTIRNSTFRNCVTMDLAFTYGSWWSPLPPQYGNVTIEGNSFGRSVYPNEVTTHAFGLNIGRVGPNGEGTMNGWRVRNNWFENNVGVSPTIGTGNVFCGNTGKPPSGWQVSCG